MSDFPLPPSPLPALGPLLSGNLWQQWADEGKVFPLERFRDAIGYLRFKPGVSCRLTVIADPAGKGENPPDGFLLHLYPDLERARTAYEKLIRREPIIGENGFAPFLNSDHPVVVSPFPNDPELPHLRHVYDPVRFRRALSEVRPTKYPAGSWRLQKRHMRTRLLAYKPGRRAVFRVRVGMRNIQQDEKVRFYGHIKVCTPMSAGPTYEKQLRIGTACPANAGWRLPTPHGFVTERSLICTEWIKGKQLENILKTPGERTTNLLKQVGQSLAEFHGLAADLAPLLSYDEKVQSLTSLAEDLKALLPAQHTRLDQMGGLLSSRISQENRPATAIIHGDFHPRQVLVDEEAGKVIIVDLDRASLGDPILDIGSFLADLLENDQPVAYRHAFLQGYARVRPLSSGAGLTTATAAALFRRVSFPFRHLHEEWPEESARILDKVEQLLGEESQ
ncbi:MAG: phosphotransferase [Planctomycetota bacterium]